MRKNALYSDIFNQFSNDLNNDNNLSDRRLDFFYNMNNGMSSHNFRSNFFGQNNSFFSYNNSMNFGKISESEFPNFKNDNNNLNNSNYSIFHKSSLNFDNNKNINNNEVNKISIPSFGTFLQIPDNNKQLAYGDYFLKVSSNLDNIDYQTQNKINIQKLNNNSIIINNIISNNNNTEDAIKEKKPKKILNNKIIISNNIMNDNNINNANNNKIKNKKKNEQEDFNPLFYGHPKKIKYKTVKEKLNVHKKFDKECREDTFSLLYTIQKLKKLLENMEKDGKIQDDENFEQLKEIYTRSILSIQHKLYAQTITGDKIA